VPRTDRTVIRWSRDRDVYGFWSAHLAVGAASAIAPFASFAEAGIDDLVAAAVSGAGGALATVAVTMSATNTGLGSIVGTDGAIRSSTRSCSRPASRSRSVTTRSSGGTARVSGAGRGSPGSGPRSRAVADGGTDSPAHSLQSSSEVLRMLDTVRDQSTQEDSR
jgi:hypothetical protein